MKHCNPEKETKDYISTVRESKDAILCPCREVLGPCRGPDGGQEQALCGPVAFDADSASLSSLIFNLRFGA